MASSYTSLEEIETKIGKDLNTLRLLKNIDRRALSDTAGISLNALKRLENGEGSSLNTFVKILIVLEKHDWLAGLAPYISVNPLTLTRRGGARKRATGSRKTKEKSNLAHKSNWLMSKYGLTVDQYVKMFDAQGGACGNPGCRIKLDIKSSTTHIDHNHSTGKIRSILCSGCNLALGFLKESDSRAGGLVEYIKKFNT